MEVLLLWQAILLGMIEGLTEFLPVSSTGHLIITGDLIGFAGEKAKTFEIFIQLGSILGVVWYYRQRVLGLVFGLHRPVERRLAINITVAFLPAAIMGLLAYQTIKAHLFSPITVGGALIAGGLVILAIERWHQKPRPQGRMTHGHIRSLADIRARDALRVGLGQMLALFPGVSRAGATIMGGLVAGLSRTAATEFSFFLAMPTMLSATVYDLVKNRDLLRIEDLPIFAAGFVVAFVVGLIVVKTFLKYVGRHTFVPFAWYRIFFGLLVLFWFLP